MEYLDLRGAVQKGKFVELMPNGAVKVRIDDGSTRLLPPNRVRLPGGAASPAGAAQQNPDQPSRVGTAEKPAAGGVTVRTWTDASGEHKIEAEFIALADGQVELKRTDGRVIKVALDKLSPTDQEIAAALAKRPTSDPFHNPPARDDHADSSSPTQGSGSPLRVSELKSPEPSDGSLARIVNLESPWGWFAMVDAPTDKMPQIPPIKNYILATIPPLSTNSNDAFSEDITGVLGDIHRQWLWCSIGSSKDSKIDQPPSVLHRIDLASGKLLAPIVMPVHAWPLTISPSGKQLITARTSYRVSGDWPLDVWKLGDDSLEHVRCFSPKAGNLMNAPAHCMFVDEDHVLTAPFKFGDLVLWNLRTLNAVYRVRTNSVFALSPNRKFLVIGESSGVFVLEALTGRVIGQFDPPAVKTPGDEPVSVAVSNDGSRVAAGSKDSLWEWDFADGALLRHFRDSAHNYAPSIAYGKNRRFLVVNQREVFDWDTGLFVFSPSVSSGQAIDFQDHEFAVFPVRALGKPNQYVVAKYELPTPQMLQLANQKFQSLPSLIRKGSKIRLDLQLPFAKADLAKIRAANAEFFRSRGFELVEDNAASDCVLTYGVGQRLTKRIQIRPNLDAPPTDEREIPTPHAFFELRRGNVSATTWKDFFVWQPKGHIVVPEPGKTLEESLNNRPDPTTFYQPPLPLYFPPQSTLLLGDITTQGIEIRG